MRVAIHYAGAAKLDDGRVRTTSECGRIADALAERAGRVTVVAYEPRPGSADREDDVSYVVRAPNVDLLSLGPQGSRWSLLERRRRVRRIVRGPSASWDVLLLRFANRRAHTLWRASRAPRVVVQIGGSPWRLALAARTRVFRLLYGLRNELNQRRVASNADIVFVVSKRSAQSYRGDVRVVPDASLVTSHVANDRLASSTPLFIVVGHLSAAKGSADAMRAFASIRASVFPDATLDVVGDGPALGELRALAPAGAVTFHGWVSDADTLASVYAGADVLLHLSRAEDVPRVIWEALSSSVLVVATPVGAISDEFDGVVSLVDDVDGAVDAVRRLANDPAKRRQMIADGRARASSVTVDAVASSIVAAIEERWPELAADARTTR